MAYGTIGPVEKTTVYIDERSKRELEALAKRLGRPQAELLREALVQFLERQKRPSLPTFVATTAVGGDASVDVRRLRERWQRELSQGDGG
jgi:Ribbon-helix-helix protein, copG family